MTYEWQRVVEAADCTECFGCGELVCPVCEWHFALCPCPGPHQDDEYTYQRDGFGNLIARRWLPGGTMSDDDHEMHLRLAPVVDLPCVTSHDIAVDRVLTQAVGKLRSVVVIGFEQDGDGEFWFASNHADGGPVLWLLELARIKLMKAGGA